MGRRTGTWELDTSEYHGYLWHVNLKSALPPVAFISNSWSVHLFTIQRAGNVQITLK